MNISSDLESLSFRSVEGGNYIKPTSRWRNLHGLANNCHTHLVKVDEVRVEDRHVVLGGVADGPQLLDEGRLVVGGPDVGALEHEPGAHDVHLAVLAVLNQNVFIIVPGNSEQYARARICHGFSNSKHSP